MSVWEMEFYVEGDSEYCRLYTTFDGAWRGVLRHMKERVPFKRQNTDDGDEEVLECCETMNDILAAITPGDNSKIIDAVVTWDDFFPDENYYVREREVHE